jgi:uncharacterized protein YcbK (DUF882 family)
MKHFKIDEFSSPDLPGSGDKMNADFLDKLDRARALANIPFIITSGYRTKAHNKLVGGVDGSAHTTGHAADISCRDSVSRYRILKSLMEVGFNRIGVADTFIHVDSDPTKSKNCIWTY